MNVLALCITAACVTIVFVSGMLVGYRYRRRLTARARVRARGRAATTFANDVERATAPAKELKARMLERGFVAVLDLGETPAEISFLEIKVGAAPPVVIHYDPMELMFKSGADERFLNVDEAFAWVLEQLDNEAEAAAHPKQKEYVQLAQAPDMVSLDRQKELHAHKETCTPCSSLWALIISGDVG